MPERNSSSPPSIPVIFGCSGLTLTESERRFFQKSNPIGLILFSRNCQSPEQVRRLVIEFKESVSLADPLILIDQEGGRVQRLGPPHWPAYPAVGKVAALADSDPIGARNAVYLFGRLLASDLTPLGINVNCAPVLDVLQVETHEIIGDRAFGNNKLRVAELGRALCEGLLAGGVLPIIKHIPGHGRADVDSHKELPIVNASVKELETVDFAPFYSLRNMPFAMTAHIVFTALDSGRPVTMSDNAIQHAIRGRIEYKGLLFSDDITMMALSGGMDKRAREAQDAGCDLVLHCNGVISEMELVAGAVQQTPRHVEKLLASAESFRKASFLNYGFDPDHWRFQLDVMLDEVEKLD